MTHPAIAPVSPAAAGTAHPDPIGRLTWLYAGALALIGGLAVLCQVVTQPALLSERDQIPVLNVAGAQRMLSQKIAKAALAFGSAESESERRAYAAELGAAIAVWPEVHRRLQQGEPVQGSGQPRSDPEIAAAYSALEPHVHSIRAAAERLVAISAQPALQPRDRDEVQRWVREIMAHEGAFLAGMEDIVSRYSRAMHARLDRAQRDSMLFAAAVLLALVFTAFVVFRPATGMIRRQLSLLQEGEQRFRTMADTAPVMIWLADPDKRCTYFNKSWLDFTGRSMEQEQGYGWAEGVHSEDVQRCLKTYSEAFDARREFRLEYRLRHFDGEYRWLLDQGEPRFAPDGGFAGYIGSCVDITERKLAEQERERLLAQVEQERHQAQQTAARLAATLSAIADGLVIYRHDGSILSLNASAERMLGYSEEQRAMPLEQRAALWSLETAEGEPCTQEAYPVSRALRGETVRNIALVLRLPDGARRWISASAAPIPDPQGAVCGAVATLSDITERRRAEEQLAARARQQEAVAELGQRALAGAEPQALMQEACALLAQTLDLELAKVLELLAGGERLLLRAGVGWRDGLVGRLTMEAGTHSQAGYTLLANGPVIVEDHAAETRFHGPPLLHDHGVVSGMSVIVAGRERPFGVLGAHTTRRRRFSRDDVHVLQAVAHVLASAIERSRAETEITRWKERYETAVAASSLVLYDWDTDAGSLTFGGSFRQVLGYSEGELSGGMKAWMGLIHPEDRNTVAREMEQVLATHAHSTMEYRVRRRDGEYIHVRAEGHFSGDTSGDMHADSVDGGTHMIGLISDITQHKRVERMKTEFVSTVSHELRTPLTSITGSLGLINGGVAGELSERARTLVEIAYRNSERLVRLINDILDIDKIESGRSDVALEPVDLMGLVGEALDSNRTFAAQYQVRLRVGRALPGVRVCADPNRLMQVLTNLLSNAAKFSPVGGTVDVSVTRDEEWVRVAVTDHGPGVPESFRPYLFQKFAQADTSDARARGGTGLGLSIAKAIIDQFGGRIGCESMPGQGATFYFELRAWQGA